MPASRSKKSDESSKENDHGGYCALVIRTICHFSQEESGI